MYLAAVARLEPVAPPSEEEVRDVEVALASRDEMRGGGDTARDPAATCVFRHAG